ncbi:ferritin-like domain-containing protein [Streptomyces scopuliridis]|uniref:ferritin-like domain-containing protein n=1 Tax=Streptomyces scopuliridis TaxID=452529 RepID=UPI0035E1D0A6
MNGSDIGAARQFLDEALCEVAELEHSLCLQYLYAAFSLKVRPDEGGIDVVQTELVREWKGQFLLLAREEMLHLGLVLNLQAAIGAPPYLRRPNFPQPERYYPLGTVAALEPFSLAAVDRFLAYEMPAALLPPAPTAGDDAMTARLTVGQLYDRIRAAIVAADERELFIGSELRQVDTVAVIDPEGVLDGETTTGYGVEPFAVTCQASALHAVDLIVEQGEGADEAGPDSHYNRLLRIRAELLAEAEAARRSGRPFEPTRPALDNPLVVPAPDAEGGSLITAPLAREAAELFDAGYALTVLMLLRFYSRVDESPSERSVLQRVLFFPLMTMFTRPLGEILTELPAGSERAGPTAGPPFQFQRGLSLIPERGVALRVFGERLTDLAARAQRLTGRMRDTSTPPRLTHRMELIAKDLARIRRSFHEATKGAAHD